MEVKKQKRTRKDKITNQWKVAKILVVKPLATQREIAKEAGIWLWNVNRQLNELERNGTKDPRILNICDADLDIVTLWQAELLRRLWEEPTKMWTRDIVAAMDNWTRRYTIFKWDITDENWWLKQLQSEEKRKAIADRLAIDE